MVHCPNSITVPNTCSKAHCRFSSWFIWHASLLRVPVTTLQRSKYEGGWILPDITLKCKTLLYNRIQILGANDGTVLDHLFRYWAMKEEPPNPPQAVGLPKQFAHLQQYHIDIDYIAPPTPTDNRHTPKRRIYITLLQISRNATADNEMIVRKHPEVDKQRVWRNILTSRLTNITISLWYAAINDILPTHDRLAAILLAPTVACQSCQN